MKIPPPGGPPPGPKPDEIAKGPPQAAEPRGASFAEKLGQVGGAEQAAQAGEAQKVGAQMASHLEAVGREMAAGQIRTKEEAIARVVDRLLDARFQGKLPAGDLARMKTAVAAQVAADPHLSERIDRLLKPG